MSLLQFKEDVVFGGQFKPRIWNLFLGIGWLVFWSSLSVPTVCKRKCQDILNLKVLPQVRAWMGRMNECQAPMLLLCIWLLPQVLYPVKHQLVKYNKSVFALYCAFKNCIYCWCFCSCHKFPDPAITSHWGLLLLLCLVVVLQEPAPSQGQTRASRDPMWCSTVRLIRHPPPLLINQTKICVLRDNKD